MEKPTNDCSDMDACPTGECLPDMNMPTPLTPDLAELKRLYNAMTNLPHKCVEAGQWYFAAQRDFPALIAIAEEAVALRARVAELEADTLERAAKLVDCWHIRKGGYGNLAEAIRSLITPVTP